MRKILLLLISSCISCSLWASTPDGGSLLGAFDAKLKELGCYRVKFEVKAEGYTAMGEYVVSGSDFYVASDGVEVYVENGVKYQVNRESREIVIDSAATLGSDIISNPAQGFSSLSENFQVTEAVEGGRRSVSLASKQGAAVSEAITIVADERGELPARIVYAGDGGSIIIEVKSVERSSAGLPRFDIGEYAGYESVDMR